MTGEEQERLTLLAVHSLAAVACDMIIRKQEAGVTMGAGIADVHAYFAKVESDASVEALRIALSRGKA